MKESESKRFKTINAVWIFIAILVANIIMLTIHRTYYMDTDTRLVIADYQELVDTVSPEESQFCRRAAALILSGNYEQAKQYEADFGVCMRKVVKRISNLNGEGL